MKIPWKHFCLLLLVTASGKLWPAQDTPSLGDVARKTREQKPTSPAKRVVTEDTLPRHKRLRQHYCLPVARSPHPPQPCSHVEVDVNVPGEAKQGGGYNYYSHYNLKLENGHGYRVAFWPEDTSVGEPRLVLENAKEHFVQTVVYGETESDFTSPAKVLYAEDTFIGDKPALLITFQGGSDRGLRRGVALLIVVVPAQVIATSCVFLLEDVSEAAPVCDNIVKSAQVIVYPHNDGVWRSDDGGEP